MLMKKLMILAASSCLALAAAPAIFAQASTPPATAAFDVADVHVSPYVKFPYKQQGVLTGNRYTLHQATMTQIIATAYSLNPLDVQGGPSWMDWDRFDIDGKVVPITASGSTRRLMLQSLLADRFKLVAHTGIAPMPAYVLTAPKGKSMLKEGTGDAGCDPIPPPSGQAAGSFQQNVVSCHNETMKQFAKDVNNMAGDYLDKPVVDSTGLDGAYDFEFQWTYRGALDRAGADAITIYDAMEKQLGLKLMLQTAPRQVLLVDSVNETPTPNVPDLDKRMPPAAPPQIDVATVRPSKPDEKEWFSIKGYQMNATAIPLREIIGFAWDLNPGDSEAIQDAPKWLQDDKFDIVAKMVSDDSLPKGPQVLQQQLQQMLKTLVEDRFQMKDHWENRPVSAYNLVAVSPKLTKADPKSRTHCVEGPGSDGKDPRLVNPALNRLLTCQNLSMAQFGTLLPSLAGGFIYDPVLDTTGLKGSYNFTLSFSSADHFAPGKGAGTPSADGSSQPSDPNGAISLFDAVKNQLGLKLEKQKRPVPVLVIDHIEETPTAN
jgi:uncharacterized protein (TIGR03435 family)